MGSMSLEGMNRYFYYIIKNLRITKNKCENDSIINITIKNVRVYLFAILKLLFEIVVFIFFQKYLLKLLF